MPDNNEANNIGEKPPPKSPSYLIWSIFTRDREIQKARSIEKRIYTSAGNRAKSKESPNSKSAPPGSRPGLACNLSSADIIASQLSHSNYHSHGELMESLLWIRVEGRREYTNCKKQNQGQDIILNHFRHSL